MQSLQEAEGIKGGKEEEFGRYKASDPKIFEEKGFTL